MSDINFDDDLAPRRITSKTPRRRRNEDYDNDDDFGGTTLETSRTQEPEEKPARRDKKQDNSNRPTQAISGWDDDSMTGSQMPKNTSSRRRLSNELDSGNDKKAKLKSNYDEVEDNIPQIPDLEETNDFDDMAFQVADAPDVQVHQISSYKELDKEFFKEKAFQFLEGNIDVSLLHCGLFPEEQIVEDDKIWEWNKLFTEVVSILTVEEEHKAQQEEEKFKL